MWLTRQGSRSSGARLRRGQVSGTGEQLRIQGESEYHSPELLFPYGYSAAAAEGGRALMLDGVCAGMAAAPDGDLCPGRGAYLFCGRGGDFAEEHGRGGHQRPKLPAEGTVTGGFLWT